MSIRYTKQHKKFDCGPVAICNIIKWSGVNISYRACKSYFEHLYNITSDGMCIKEFEKYLYSLKKYPIKIVKKIKNPKVRDLRTIDKDHSCMLLIYNEELYHATFAIDITKYYVTLVNWDKEKTLRKLTIKKFKFYLNKNTILYIIEKVIPNDRR